MAYSVVSRRVNRSGTVYVFINGESDEERSQLANLAVRVIRRIYEDVPNATIGLSRDGNQPIRLSLAPATTAALGLNTLDEVAAWLEQRFNEHRK